MAAEKILLTLAELISKLETGKMGRAAKKICSDGHDGTCAGY